MKSVKNVKNVKSMREQRGTILRGALIGCFATASLGIALISSLDTRKDRAASATEAYSRALQSARTSLAHRMQTLATDATFAQNLDFALANSTTKQIQSQLHAGELDALRISTRRCAALFDLKTVALEFPACGDGGTQEGFSWHSVQGIPVLRLTTHLETPLRGELLLQGQLVLSQDWRSRFPDLVRSWETLDLSYGFDNGAQTSARRRIAMEGLDGLGRHVASLYSADPILAFLPAQTALRRPADHSLPIGLLVLCIPLFFALLRTNERRHRDELSGRLEELRRTHEKEQAKVQSEIAALETKRSEAEHKAQSLAAKLHRLGALESTVAQMRSTMNGVVASHRKLRHQSETMAGDLCGVIATAGQRITDVVLSWDDGIRTKGIRKFLRSLSEVECATPGRSLLEVDFATLFKSSKTIRTKAEKSGTLAAEIGRQSDEIQKLVNYWQSLCEPNSRNTKIRSGASARDLTSNPTPNPPANLTPNPKMGHSGNWNGIIDETERLFAHNSALSGWTVIDRVPPATQTTAATPIPTKIWPALIYHVATAFQQSNELSDREEISVYRRQTRGCEVIVLALSSARNGRRPPKPDLDRLNAGLAAANNVLAPYGGTCEAMVTPSGHYPVGIRWPASEAKKSPVDTGLAAEKHRPHVS